MKEKDKENKVLTPFIKKFIQEYPIEKEHDFNIENQLVSYIQNTFLQNIFNLEFIDETVYSVKDWTSSYSKWESVPWVGIFDKKITRGPSQGVFVIYLLSQDKKTLYLSFQISNFYEHFDAELNDLRKKIDPRGFSTSDIHLASPERKYLEKGSIFSKAYDIEHLPDENELQKDLHNCILMYKDFAKLKNYTDINHSPKCDKNIILYGPPGTGKTYHTAIYAVAICTGRTVEEIMEEINDPENGQSYEQIMEEYNELKKDHRIAFTTFHQSYGYEEFIEGIKPKVDNTNGYVEYTIEDGVFKDFCNQAMQIATMEIQKDAAVWGIRYNNYKYHNEEREFKEDCLKDGIIKFKFMEHEGELRECFQNTMKIGDYVVTHLDDSRIDAIGRITGCAEFNGSPVLSNWYRNVEWIVKDCDIDLRDINKRIYFHNSELYRMENIKPMHLVKLIPEERPPYVFIIDEINRGNISKIFGELITLLEDTKRAGMPEAASVTLPYSGETFTVPKNVYILGTMNTADRSIALMDTALRRRFQFIEMMPNSDVLRNIHADKVEDLDVAHMLDVINQRISFLFDREHTIGHAFFTKLAKEPTLECLQSIFKKSVIPLLQEYFYEDYQKIQLVLGDNGKSNDDHKFILDEPVKPKDIFKGYVEDVIDLPEHKYRINDKSFGFIESYKEIM